MLRSTGHWLALAGAVIGLVACSGPQPFKATDLTGAEWGRDFELTAHTGQRLKTSDYHGRLQLLFFGYTHCPDICAPTLARLAGMMKQLGPDAARVQVFFVSVDPEHDTPKQLAGFVPSFDARFIGLTGSVSEIMVVARDYKVAFEGQEGGTVSHSGAVYVKDARGRLRLLIPDGMSSEDMLHDVRLLLRESGRS